MWKAIIILGIAVIAAFLITAPMMAGGIKMVKVEGEGQVPMEKAVHVPPNWMLIIGIWIIILLIAGAIAWSVES